MKLTIHCRQTILDRTLWQLLQGSSLNLQMDSENIHIRLKQHNFSISRNQSIRFDNHGSACLSISLRPLRMYSRRMGNTATDGVVSVCHDKCGLSGAQKPCIGWGLPREGALLRSTYWDMAVMPSGSIYSKWLIRGQHSAMRPARHRYRGNCSKLHAQNKQMLLKSRTFLTGKENLCS